MTALFIDIEALVASELARCGRLPAVTRHAVEDAGRRAGDEALDRWLALPQRPSLRGYVKLAIRRRVIDALRRDRPGTLPGDPDAHLAASPEELMGRAQEEEAPPAPVPQPGRRLVDLTPAELVVLDLRLTKGLTLKAVSLAMDRISPQRVHAIEKSVRRKLGLEVPDTVSMRKTTQELRVITRDRSGTVTVYRPPASQPRVGPKVQAMTAERRAAMEERYIHQPARKRAAGLCPEPDCNELAHDPTTARCRRHAARWPARKSRDDYQPATDGLIEEEVTDVAA